MIVGKKEAIYVVIVSVFSYILGTLIQTLGLNRRVYNHVPGECASVGQFSEVSDFDTSFDGTVFLAASRCTENCSSTTPRNIFIFNVDNKTSWELTIIDSKHKLNPGGISVTPSRNNIHFLAINQKKRPSVEIYLFNSNKKSLKHLRSVRSKKFLNLMDVAAVDREKFFVTSHSFFENSYLQIAEKIFNVNTGSVIFFDGKSTYQAASLPSPVGIIYDKFRSLLFVASFSQEAILVFKVEKNYSLTFVDNIKLYCSPYSIWRDIDNSMVITCHPVFLRYASYLQNQTAYYSPSQVLRVYYRSTGESMIQQLYANDGATVSAAVSAIRTGNTLLIAAQSDLLSCDLINLKQE